MTKGARLFLVTSLASILAGWGSDRGAPTVAEGWTFGAVVVVVPPALGGWRCPPPHHAVGVPPCFGARTAAAAAAATTTTRNTRLHLGAGRDDDGGASAGDVVDRGDLPERVHDEKGDEVRSSFRRIVGHDGPLRRGDTNHRGSAFSLLVEWRDGGSAPTYEALGSMLERDSTSVVAYAKAHNLLDAKGWGRVRRAAQAKTNRPRPTRQKAGVGRATAEGGSGSAIAAPDLSGLQDKVRGDVLLEAEMRGNIPTMLTDDDDDGDGDAGSVVSDLSGLRDKVRELRRAKYVRGDSISEAEMRGNKPMMLMDDGGGGVDADPSLAEWIEWDREIDAEAAQQQRDQKKKDARRMLEVARERIMEEVATLDALSSAGGDSYSDDSGEASQQVNRSMDESSLLPGAVPASGASGGDKKFISDYQTTSDGAVFLSASAYRQACDDAANPDGSLNFLIKGGATTTGGAAGRPSPPGPLAGGRPMAPYGSPEDGGGRKITAADLAREAALGAKMRDDPKAREEYHRRLMEEEAEYGQEPQLFEEALTDPSKAREFWNQDFLEKQRQDVAALEQSLDQTMEELRRRQQSSPRTVGTSGGRSQRTKEGSSTRDMFFASAEQGKKFTEMIEKVRIERANRVAEFYDAKDPDSPYEYPSQDGFMGSDGSLLTEDPTVKIGEEALHLRSPEKPGAGKDEWIFVEDPINVDEPFYWNSNTGEMKY